MFPAHFWKQDMIYLQKFMKLLLKVWNQKTMHLNNFCCRLFPKEIIISKIWSWIIERKTVLSSEDIRKIVDEHFYKQAIAKVENSRVFRDITNIRRSDSIATSNFSLGNTTEKINVIDFPDIKDKIANRESSPIKSPSTIWSSKGKKSFKRKVKSKYLKKLNKSRSK